MTKEQFDAWIGRWFAALTPPDGMTLKELVDGLFAHDAHAARYLEGALYFDNRKNQRFQMAVRFPRSLVDLVDYLLYLQRSRADAADKARLDEARLAEDHERLCGHNYD